MKMFKMTTGGGGQALLRSKQSAAKKALLYILTPIFCVALLCGTVFSFYNKGDKAYAATGPAPASIIGLKGDFASKLQGKQNENIYFGTNGSSGTVKWRVLSTNGSKYGSGMLLWADKQLGTETYNSGPNQSSSAQPNYAYWSTSKIRASLNGGQYPNSVTGTNMPNATTGGTISTDASWYGKLFSDAEKQAVEAAGSYTTDNWGIDTSKAQYEYMTSNITANAYGVNGKYNQSILGTGTAASAVKTSDNGVQETSSGDKLFLLDYYDINNTSLGFGDGALTYAKSIDSTWTETSGYYPGYYTGSGKNFNNKTSNYLKFSGEAADYYWLRPAGRNSTSGSRALIVNSSGCIDYDVVSNSFGVRPAFNFNPDTVVYATAANLTSMGSTLSSVTDIDGGGKPAYKVYTKSGNYATNNNTAKAKIAINGKTLNMAYNNPTVTTAGSGVTSGKLVLLLSKNGVVEYQAEQTMDGSATSTGTTTTTFTLPDGVDYTDYTANLLFTSANGGVASETVYCSYNLEGGIEAPQNISGLTFDNQNKWTEVAKSSWYDAQIHGNSSFVTVKSIEYTDKLGNPPTTDLTGNTTNIKNAGTYKVTLELASGLKWSSGDGTFTITIDQAKPNVTADFKNKPLPNPLYVSYNDGKLPELTNVHEQATPGKLEWQSGEKPDETKTKYYWQFTPESEIDTTIKNNYSVISDKTKETEITVTYKKQSVKNLEIVLHKVSEEEGAANVSIYDAYTLADGDYSVKKFITVYAVMDDGVTKVELQDSEYDLELEDGSETLSAESLTLVAINADGKTGKLNITALESKVVDLLVTYKDNGTHLVYSDTLSYDDVKTNLTVRAQWNYSGDDYLEVKDKSKYTITGEIKAGTPITLTANYGGKSKDFKPTIDKGTLTPTVTFEDLTVTYDGNDKKIEATVSGLPEGFTLTPAYTVTGDSTTYVAAGYANAGTYNYTVSFTHDNPNYEQYTATKTATLEIEKADYPDADKIEFKKQTVTHDGNSHKLEATGVPTGVTVTYVYNGSAPQTAPFEFSNVNETGYSITAKFAHTNANYKDIDDITQLLIITDKETYTNNLALQVTGADGSNNSYTATYDPDSAISFTLSGKLLDKDGAEVTFTPTYVYEREEDGAWGVVAAADLKNAGNYRVTVSVATGDPTYADVDDLQATLTIDKADYDMSGVEFKDKTFTYNGEKHSLEIGGDLPEGMEVSYSCDTDMTAIGTHTVTATFTNPDPKNYKDPKTKTAKLTINDAVITEIKAELSEKNYTTANGLDDLKAKLKVTAVYSNGTEAEIEDYELDFTGLRDGGKFKYGNQSLTVKYGSFTDIINNIMVSREKVALPTFKGGLNYTGVELKPKAADFNGYDETLMAFVVDKLQSGLAVGSYKAVFALNDPENYQWVTATTLKKTVFAAVVYDGEVTLNANEAAVDWNISKAVLTATKSDGALPIFASESYIGAFSDVVTLKYYKDEACTEEVAAEDLARETQYYVKAELIDTDNFELDASAAQYTVKSFTYTTPAKELTIWDKIVRFLKTNWLWLVIAVVALLFLIILICIIASAKKKKRKKEELEEQRRLEKEEREREERKLEREERMARLNQQQAMPQMMMPQMMPQMMQQQMPQMSQMGGQSMANGGASSNEIAELKAEISAMKAEAAAKESAALRAEVMRAEQAAMKAEQNAVLRSDVNAIRGEQFTGINMDAMTEIMTRALKNVFASAVQPVVTAPPAQPAQLTDGGSSTATANAVYPPDAVMTTVTTTKIDTTKKTAQSAPNADRAAAPVRTVVRNVVAPMPVDDGRIFDVGGFYKPADPVDMGLEEEDKKD